MTAIHQFVAGFSNGDAISNEALSLQAIFRGWGCASDVFSEARRILPQLRAQAADVSEYASRVRPDDIVILHLSIGSPVNLAFAALPCRKVIRYHNITPTAYFAFVNPQTAVNLALGRQHVLRLAGVADLNLAVSRFNASELESAGYRDVRVLPLFFDMQRMETPPDRQVLRRYADGRTNILFVGRVAPNKKTEDVIDAFGCFQRNVEAASRLLLVGSWAGAERYYYWLVARAREQGLDQVVFTGAVPQAQLNAYYRVSRLFLCMSEHEGFCIPILESMAHDVPVLAYRAAAVPETMDGAGVLVNEKAYDYVAEMMGAMVHDASLRAALLAGQQARLARYRTRDLAAELRALLAPFRL